MNLLGHYGILSYTVKILKAVLLRCRVIHVPEGICSQVNLQNVLFSSTQCASKDIGIVNLHPVTPACVANQPHTLHANSRCGVGWGFQDLFHLNTKTV